MWQTLGHIPHQIGPLTVFGLGWALIGWLLFSGWALFQTVKHEGFSSSAQSQLATTAIFAVIIVWVLPWLEQRLAGAEQPNPGIPIRGYGVMLLLAVVSSVRLALARSDRMGLDRDQVYGLAMWMFVGGIVGARLFFVIQKWDQFPKQRLWEFLAAAVNIAEGGLVVYGSLIGATLSSLLFLSRQRMPIWRTADMAAPCLLLGLAIGRVGCLMNGCCYGGPCDLPWAIEFPATSPAYQDRRASGEFHGFRFESNPDGGIVITAVEAEQPAAQAGLSVGQIVQAINGYPLDKDDDDDHVSAAEQASWRLLDNVDEPITVTLADGQRISWSDRLPISTRPVHPTQIYSAINAFILCFFLLAVTPYCRDGQVFAWLLTLYPISRFILEMIRVDEGAFLNTGMTISQVISLGLLVLGILLWFRTGRGIIGERRQTKMSVAA